jgi:hypothetical protein
MKNTKEEPDSDGTYANAMSNPSKDYMVAEIPIFHQIDTHRNSVAFLSLSQTSNFAHNISLMLGNETRCTNSRICNGPLKPGTSYK